MLLSFCTRVLKHRYALGAETDRGSKSHTLCFWSHNSPKEGTVERARKGGLGGPVLEGGAGSLGAGRVTRWGVLGRLLRPGAPPFTFPIPPHLRYQELGYQLG